MLYMKNVNLINVIMILNTAFPYQTNCSGNVSFGVKIWDSWSVTSDLFQCFLNHLCPGVSDGTCNMIHLCNIFMHHSNICSIKIVIFFNVFLISLTCFLYLGIGLGWRKKRGEQNLGNEIRSGQKHFVEIEGWVTHKAASIIVYLQLNTHCLSLTSRGNGDISRCCQK